MVQVFAQKLQGISRAPLEAAITPVLRAHGVGSVEISYQMERGGWVLRVIVESLEETGGAIPEASESRAPRLRRECRRRAAASNAEPRPSVRPGWAERFDRRVLGRK